MNFARASCACGVEFLIEGRRDLFEQFRPIFDRRLDDNVAASRYRGHVVDRDDLASAQLEATDVLAEFKSDAAVPVAAGDPKLGVAVQRLLKIVWR